jgi:hypothetical protein
MIIERDVGIEVLLWRSTWLRVHALLIMSIYSSLKKYTYPSLSLLSSTLFALIFIWHPPFIPYCVARLVRVEMTASVSVDIE